MATQLPSERAAALPQVFFKHNHENQREARLVTRSSCVFYFVHRADVRTQVLFMNYWAEKRHLSDVSMRITLRSMGGHQLLRKVSDIAAVGGYVVDVNDLLDELSESVSEGSIEIEFLSNENMVIAYPAALVRYVGADWHTVGHASQRYYSESSGDEASMIEGGLHEAEEGNITIHEGTSIPFFIIHNGPHSIPPQDVEVRVTSASGRVTSAKLAGVAWAPYQTRFFKLGDIFDYRAFLKNERGAFSVKFAISGVFPRLIAGSDFGGKWSIDHTNFAATSGEAAADVFAVNDDPAFKNLVFNLPNNFADGWRCWTDIYPTYPADRYEIEVRALDQDGRIVRAKSFPIAKDTDACFPRIELNDAKNADANFEFLFENPRELPRRFHMGIHYQIGDGPAGFLTDGPIPHSTPPIRTRWLPVFEEPTCKNHILIANRTAGLERPSDVAFALRLFNSLGDEPLTGSLVVPKNRSLCLKLGDLFPDYLRFLKSRPGWIYMTADHPQRCVIHYASVYRANSLAVCHAF